MDSLRKTPLPAAIFTLYMFIFLLTELTVNARCAFILGRECVTPLYAAGILCTSAGYFAFYLLGRALRSQKGKSVFIIVCTLLYSICVFLFMLSKNENIFTVAAIASLLFFGCIGGYIHYALALLLQNSPYAGRTVGAGVALSTLLQFVVQNFFSGDIFLLVCMVLGSYTLAYCAIKPVKEKLPDTPALQESKNAACGKTLLFPVCIVAAMSFCFGLGDGIVTKLDAAGIISLTSFPRLLYAAGAIAAGVVADIKTKKLLPLCTLCMLAIFSVTALFIGNVSRTANTVYVCVMYIFSGFYIMYLTLTFLRLASKTAKPELWAGMGRIVRGVFIAVAAAGSNALFEGIGMQGIVIAGICLSLVVLILFVFDGGLNIRPEQPASAPEDVRGFTEAYRLTPRESEVLEKLVASDATNKDIAKELYVSVRVLERHVTSIYEKTGVQSRVGLVKLYYSDK